MEDEEIKKSKSAYAIGQDLSLLSVEELEKTIELLKVEIDRLQHARSEKTTHLSKAEELFAKK